MGRGQKLIAAVITIGTFVSSSHAGITIVGTTYDVLNIGALTGMPNSAGISVSNTGYVAGAASNANFQQAFNWSQSTGLHWLGTGQSFPEKINDSGQVIGTAFSPSSSGVLWNADGSVAHVFNSSAIDQPTGLNNTGQVTGYRNSVSLDQTAYVWNGAYVDLGYPHSAITSHGYDINNSGLVAGDLGAFSSSPTAFLWSQDSGFTTIITSNTFQAINVNDLSDQGMIVGDGQWNGGANHVGWKWDASTGFSLLSTLPSAALTMARAVNDNGLIVGSSGAFGTLWDDQGNIYKANDLLAPGYSNWNITALWGINNDGWLTGEAIPSGSTNSVAVLLRPVPEPTSTGLILLSCASLLVRRRGYRLTTQNEADGVIDRSIAS